MGILQERRKHKAVCAACQSPNYTMEPHEIPGFRPGFRCGQCGNFWTNGQNGGIYAELASEEIWKAIKRRNR